MQHQVEISGYYDQAVKKKCSEILPSSREFHCYLDSKRNDKIAAETAAIDATTAFYTSFLCITLHFSCPRIPTIENYTRYTRYTLISTFVIEQFARTT